MNKTQQLKKCDYCHKEFEHINYEYFNHNCNMNGFLIPEKITELMKLMDEAHKQGKINSIDHINMTNSIAHMALSIRTKWID